jgi:major cell surface glycoprotein (TIGR04216 family)
VDDSVTATPSRTSNTPNQQPALPPDSPLILDINEQVATEDGTVAVRGVARGPERVLVFFVDRRGGYASTVLSVDNNNEFDSDDVPLVTIRGEPMAEGLVVAGVFAVGRDGVVGDGAIDGFTRADLEALDENTRQQILARLSDRLTGPGLTQQQVLEILFAESVGEEGSDDLIVEDLFVLTDGRTTIETIVPASADDASTARPLVPGETMVVQGLTNRKPDDTTIFVEVVDGPSADLFEFTSTSDWGTDGVWSVSLQIPADVEPGTYTVRADDGDDAETAQVTIQSSGGNTTASGDSRLRP